MHRWKYTYAAIMSELRSKRGAAMAEPTPIRVKGLVKPDTALKRQAAAMYFIICSRNLFEK